MLRLFRGQPSPDSSVNETTPFSDLGAQYCFILQQGNAVGAITGMFLGGGASFCIGYVLSGGDVSQAVNSFCFGSMGGVTVGTLIAPCFSLQNSRFTIFAQANDDTLAEQPFNDEAITVEPQQVVKATM